MCGFTTITEQNAKFLLPEEFPAGEVRRNVAEVSSPFLKTLLEAAQAPQDISKRCAYIKVLTTFAMSQKLIVTRLLTKNCQILMKMAVKSHTQADLERASAVIRDAFKVTVSDHQEEEPLTGRTTQCYALSVCLLTLYSRMRAYALAEGILRAINQYSKVIPPLCQSDVDTQIKFLFYQGQINFFHQKFEVATACFENALAACGFKISPQKLKHISAFLIPAKYISTGCKPNTVYYQAVPQLASVYKPLIDACKAGNLPKFQHCLNLNAELLKKNQVLLAFHAMIPNLRLNLFRRTWLLTGMDSKIPLKLLGRMLTIVDFPIISGTDTENAEFYLAQHIYSGDIKGYIHHNLGLVILSKKMPFPKLVRSSA